MLHLASDLTRCLITVCGGMFSSRWCMRTVELISTSFYSIPSTIYRPFSPRPPCNAASPVCRQLITQHQADEYELAAALATYNQTKNRSRQFVPPERWRVHLSPRPGVEGSDYINATALIGQPRGRAGRGRMGGGGRQAAGVGAGRIAAVGWVILCFFLWTGLSVASLPKSTG